MRRRLSLAGLLLVVALVPGTAPADDIAGPDLLIEMTPVVSPPPVPAAILETLPPGARLPSVDAPPAEVRDLTVSYTVDPVLEAHTRKALELGRVDLGHVIVLDPRDGQVLAYVSTDPVAFPAAGIYPTASLMKVVTAAAVLQRAPEAAKQDCRYVGSPYHLNRGRLRPPTSGGRVDSFWRALAISNNQCFGRLAVDHVGSEPLVAEMSRLGLLESPAPGHPAGRIEPVEDDLDLGRLGSGLAGSFISPLAAARMAAVLADGKLIEPRWIAGVTDAYGRALALPPDSAPRPVWSPEVTTELRELLVGITARGTAKSAFRDPRGRPLLGDIRVAGKTGNLSGDDPKGRYEWFIGAAPAEAPRVVIAAVVVHPPRWWAHASWVAAQVLHSIFCDGGKCSVDKVARFAGARPGAG